MRRYVIKDILGQEHIIWADIVNEYDDNYITFIDNTAGGHPMYTVAQFTRRNIIGFTLTHVEIDGVQKEVIHYED